MKGFRVKLIDESDRGLFRYIFEHIAIGFIAFYDFYYVLSRVVPVTLYTRSKSLLIICMVIASIIGIYISYRCQRTMFGVLCDLSLGVGMYLILIIGQYVRTFLIVLLSVTAVLTFIGVVFIECRRVRRTDQIRKVMYVRFVKSILLIRNNFGLAAFFICMIMPMVVRTWEKEKMYDDYRTFYYAEYCEENGYQITEDGRIELLVNEIYGDEYRLSENFDTIKLLRNDATFQTLNYEKKCQVIEALIHCEARYLGLCEINIEFKDMQKETLGDYVHNTRTITINSLPLKDGSMNGGSAIEVMETCLHECRHCYQHLLADMYKDASPEQRNLLAFTSEGVREWVANMSDYKDDVATEEGYYDYYSQILEKDARDYSCDQIIAYYQAIDCMINENQTE